MNRFAACLMLMAVLAGCGRDRPWRATDISGAMPRLEFVMTRASDGASVTAKDYRGRVTILYFGYTNCPDVCPATLANLADMLRQLGRDADRVRVLFVTVDPNRDRLSILKKYAAAFAPQVDGLRGSDNALADLARRYRVAYSVKMQPTYQVMHSSAVFFFDREGRARLVTLSTDDTAGLAEDVKRLLD
ncbi:MAG: SCO family protein [Alphaproteobacteria bacterium]|nr:SCO family protein [Alphaproteobacteria bacterium]MDE2631110.1 SCO family protein [Alphaproteobacteria bacterium]